MQTKTVVPAYYVSTDMDGTPRLRATPAITFTRTNMFNADQATLMFDMEITAVLYAKNAGFTTIRRGDEIIARRSDVTAEFWLKPVGKKFQWAKR